MTSWSLKSVRADGWFERLGEESPNFAELCSSVGDRFVAFSVIAGVRITSLTIDRRAEDATLVDFCVGSDDSEQRLPLGEFRRRLSSALLSDEPEPYSLPTAEPTSEELQELVGFRYVLLAPLFGIRLIELTQTDDGDVDIQVEFAGHERSMPLLRFRELIQDRIRSEMYRARPSSPFSIDLAVIPAAEAAHQEEDHEQVIQLLGAWPGPLSMLLRTAEGQQLAGTVKATLARALGVLGEAYVSQGRFDWAEEVMRLGIQWAQEGAAAATLFRRMGASCMARNRHGEAIGLLRRALALGESKTVVLPLLAVAYADRERWVAAMVSAEDALFLQESPEMEDIRERAKSALGPAWSQFREEFPKPHSVPTQLPPPIVEE